jgi:predicted nucleic acid-binding protein
MDQALLEDAAAELALHHDLRSLDALHLASALLLGRDDLLMLTWDRRLHAAATSIGLRGLPEPLA